MRHMDRLLGEVKRTYATTFEVTEEANARFLDRMTKNLDSSVFYRTVTARRRGRITSTTAARGDTAATPHVGTQRRAGEAHGSR